jgi:uncharacterized protein with FMN-binding domain
MALVATVTGVVWVVTYRITPHSTGLAALPPTPSPSVTPNSASPAPSPKGTNGTFTGVDVPSIFGENQVQVTIANGRITEVKALQLPYDRQRSAEISQYAGPQLRQEVLQAQSAHINIVSGATYTSEAYAQSVQDALHQAGLA